MNAITPPKVDEEENDLVRRVQDKDQKAFEILMGHNKDYLRSTCATMIYDMNLLDDLVNRVMIKVWKKLYTFQFKSSFKTWLYRIALNEARDLRRAEKLHTRNRTSINQDGDGCTILLTPSRDYRPDQNQMYKEMEQVIKTAFDQLSDSHRETLKLTMQGLTHKKIGERMKVSSGTVGTRLLHARRIIQGYLEQAGMLN